jgi:hypothetical protein
MTCGGNDADEDRMSRNRADWMIVSLRAARPKIA